MNDAMVDASWRLSGDDLRAWLDRLVKRGFSVVAPVEEEPGLTLFREITTSNEAVLEPSGKCRWSPKEFLFPKSEPLYSFRMDGSSVQISDPKATDQEQVLAGVRPCDATGLARLDDSFLSRQVDPMYRLRRERTTVVSLACAGADSECFCTAVGGSPAGTVGSDIQLARLDDGWLVCSLSDRGRELLGNDPENWEPAAEVDLEAVTSMGQRVSEEMDRSPVLREWSEVLEGGFSEHTWDELAWHCMECSACAYVCPSCSCFDMNQHGTAWGGEQSRSWDSCTFELFTRHASGHNPRETRGQRYRQRVLHKFAFRDDEQQDFRCVGCGRCITVCPAGMDILDVVRRAVEAFEGGRDGAAG